MLVKRPIWALDEDFFGHLIVVVCLSFRLQPTLLFLYGLTFQLHAGVKPWEIRLLIIQQNIDVGTLLAIVVLETK